MRDSPNRDVLLRRRASAAFLRWLARDIDRLRYPMARIGHALDRLDRACGNATWACRLKADSFTRGEVPDDGIPF